jgi:hypothetical protein
MALDQVPVEPEKPHAALRRRLEAVREWFAGAGDWLRSHGLDLASNVVLGAALIVSAVLASIPPSDVLPQGVLTLEFVGTRSHAVALQQLIHAAGMHPVVLHAIQADFCLIALYAFILWSVIGALDARVVKGEAAPRLVHRVARWTPVLAGAFDIVENLGILAIVGQWFQNVGLLATVTTFAAAMKWTLLLYAFAYLAMASVAWVRQVFDAHRRASGPEVSDSRGDAVDRLKALGEKYESIRTGMEPGPGRTQKMTEVVGEMAQFAPEAAPRVDELASSDKPGEHLAAVAILQAFVMPAYLAWLAERLLKDRPFIAYQAAVALLAALPRLSEAERKGVQARMKSVKEDLAAAGLRDAPRDQIIDEILAQP